MSTNLTTANQLSSLASAVKGKLNVLDTVHATVNGGLWLEGGGSVPIIKMYYGDNTFKITPELVPAPTEHTEWSFSIVTPSATQQDAIDSVNEAICSNRLSSYLYDDTYEAVTAYLGTEDLVALAMYAVSVSGDDLTADPLPITIPCNGVAPDTPIALVFSNGGEDMIFVEATCGANGCNAIAELTVSDLEWLATTNALIVIAIIAG